MNKNLQPLLLAAALATAFPAAAQSNAELLNELKALKERVQQLEQKLQQAQPQPGQWGMTPEQARELNRVTIKAEALQDNFTDQGYKGLTIRGQIDPTWIFNKRQDDASFVLLNNGGARYTYDNSYFGMAVLDFEKETESGTKWRLTLAPERGTGALINNGSIVHEASVSIPLSDLQTRLWLGQIPVTRSRCRPATS
jgi:predicted porin